MIVFARDSNRKNKADPGCSGVPGFPYTRTAIAYSINVVPIIPLKRGGGTLAPCAPPGSASELMHQIPTVL